MNILSVIGIGLIAAALAVVLRQQRPEFAMLVSLAAGVVLLLMVCTSIVPVIEEIRGIMELSSMPGEYVGILLRALGICFLAQIASDTCKDAGESAIASKVELAGKVMVLLISLPLFRQVLSIIHSLIL